MAPEPSSPPSRLALREFWRAALLAASVVSLPATAQAPAPPVEAAANPAASPTAALNQDGWALCNRTGYILEAATARPERSSAIVEGWLRLRPGECRIALPAPLEPGPYLVYARSSDAHRGGRREWAGTVPFCVDPLGSFSAESPPSCASMGLESRKFQPVLIERRNRWRTDFNETQAFTLEQARIAGQQRLLNDIGMDDVRVDGFAGRRLSQSIARFTTQNNLRIAETSPQLYDLLEVAARRRGNAIGLTVCNRSREVMWTAVARRRVDGWESRGWWRLSAETCMRVIDEPLVRTPHYVFAELETEGGVRSLLRTDAEFCVGRARFAVLGRENCLRRGYDPARFIATPVPDSDGQIVEFFERNFGPAGTTRLPRSPDLRPGQSDDATLEPVRTP
jgi:uncharacterized membrane protein